jgi:hypothetical protein
MTSGSTGQRYGRMQRAGAILKAIICQLELKNKGVHENVSRKDY